MNAALEVVVGDITDQGDMEAIVNAANARLAPGGGVAGAIHRAAGPGLAEECRPLAPIAPGEAVITGAHNLPNQWVIHCLGPVYGQDEPADQLLADCYHRALDLAEEKGLKSLAMPAISTGAFGFPLPAASRICAEVLAERLDTAGTLAIVRLVLFDRRARDVMAKALAEAGLKAEEPGG